MYQSRFFFFRLAKALQLVLPGARLLECYSQQKDELMMVFVLADGNEFCIRADLSNAAGILSFPAEPGRSRANSVSLFAALQSSRVEEVEAFPGDRLFRFRFDNGLRLCFKMYGQRSNLILHDEHRVLSVFNHHLKKDMDMLPLPAQQVKNEFCWHPDPEELRRRCPGFTRHLWQYWENQAQTANEADKPVLFAAMVATLCGNGPMHLCRRDDQVFLSFFPEEEILYSSSDPLEISSRYYRLFWQVNKFEQEKKQALQWLGQKHIQALERIRLLDSDIPAILNDAGYRLQADLLMAYAHQIPKGTERVKLPAFDGSGEVEIRLKKDLSVHENAERLYRKARGKLADLERIRQNLAQWQQTALELEAALKEVAALQDTRTLRKAMAAFEKTGRENDDAELPFHLIYFMQYEIRVGKNARGNEELLRISHKDDHWLHARDVPGSHVVVRKKKAATTPEPVLQRAAELAAFYSRGKTESLCPVMLTERKYVRKIKGAAAGMVKVEREKTLLVSPKP